MRTLLLTRSETEVLLEPDMLLVDLRAAFRGYSLDRGVRAQRVRSALPEPGKCEVSAEVIRDAVFVCDDRDLAVSMGAIGGAKLRADAISAELGEVIGGAHPGRLNAEQVTVYGGVGLAFQDAVAAWQIYQAALSQGLGREIEFLT